MRFTELQEACALTDGNLNRHLHALAEVGVVDDGTRDRTRPAGDDRAHHRRRAHALPRLHRRTRSRSCATCTNVADATPVRATAGRRSRDRARSNTLAARGRRAASRRDHHGRQPPLGRARGTAADRRSSPRHAARCGASSAPRREAGIDVLTVYAFSEENWGREAAEVGALMDLGPRSRAAKPTRSRAKACACA